MSQSNMPSTNTTDASVNSSNNDVSTAHASDSASGSLPLLLGMTAVCFILLAVLMVFSGNRSAYAYNDDDLMLMQNAQVNVQEVVIQNSFTKPRTVFGQIESKQQSNIGFDLNGLLSKIEVIEGASVNKGDVLARLDLARLEARQNELLSALESAKANAKLAKISSARVKELVSKKLEPEQRLDEASAQLDAANAQVSESRARLNSIQVELEKSVLTAPFNGQIVTKYVDEGTVLTAGQPVFTLLATTQLEARFGLPEQTAFGLSIGQVVDLNVGGQEFPATVKSIAQQRQLSTRTINTVFNIDIASLKPKQQALIVSGDLISLQVDIPITKRGAWVPITALASGIRGMWTLYVVKNNTVETRIVSIEYANDEKAYVTGAINGGDKLVIEGPHRLTPHQTVNNVVKVDVGSTHSVLAK